MSCPFDNTGGCMHTPDDGSCMCANDGECQGEAPCACQGYGPKLEGLVIPCLLMLLKKKPSHGYELMEELTNLPFLKSIPDPGVVYRQLRRMKTDGLVESQLEPGKGGPARTVYSLTGEGEEYLLSCVVSLKGIKCAIDNFLAVIPQYLDLEDNLSNE